MLKKLHEVQFFAGGRLIIKNQALTHLRISSLHFTLRQKSSSLILNPTTYLQHMTHTTNPTPGQYYSLFPTYFAVSQLHSVRNTCTSTLLLWFTPAFFDSTFHSSFDYFNQLLAHASPGKWLFVVNKG